MLRLLVRSLDGGVIIISSNRIAYRYIRETMQARNGRGGLVRVRSLVVQLAWPGGRRTCLYITPAACSMIMSVAALHTNSLCIARGAFE